MVKIQYLRPKGWYDVKNEKEKKMKNVTFFLLPLILLLLVAPAYSGGQKEEEGKPKAPTVSTATGVNWQKYKGQTIRVLLVKNPSVDPIVPFIPEFEEKTGIKVQIEVYADEQLRTKRETELMAGTRNLDVFTSMTGQVGKKYYEAGWYTPLKPYIDNPALTELDYDLDDFFEGELRINVINGELIGIPISGGGNILYYRKDIFEKYGLNTPETYEDLENVAKKIVELSGGEIAGIAMRGKGSTATSKFVDVLHSFGGNWEDSSGKPTMNTPEAIIAFDYYGRILREYGPEGVVNMSWPEVVDVFKAGKSAMAVESAAFMVKLDESEIGENIGYLGMPKGPAGRRANISGMGMNICGLSNKKEAAWLFIQYMTTKEKFLFAAVEKSSLSVRESIFSHPDFLRVRGKPAWAKAWIDVLKAGYHFGFAQPSIASTLEARDIIGQVLVDSILGKDVISSANNAQKKLEKLKEREGR